MSSEQTTATGLYLVKGTIGNVGTPGAPIAHFNLTVDAGAGKVNGLVEVSQATGQPSKNFKVTGTIRATGLGKFTKVVALEGPSFTAEMAIDNAWNGEGGYTYDGHQVENVPVAANANENDDMESENSVGLYRVCGTLGNVGMPGAPIVQFQLGVDAPTGRINGEVEISQATGHPSQKIPVTGSLKSTGLGKFTKVVALEGKSFTAHLSVDNLWDGEGGYTYEGSKHENLPVKKGDC